MNPFYLAAYDLESEKGLKGLKSIVKHHKNYQVPATFFVLGELMEKEEVSCQIVELLDDELFDIQVHSYSHVFPIDNIDESFKIVEREIKKSCEIISHRFGRQIVGFRTPMGFEYGLKGRKKILNCLWENNIRFVSSKLMGKGNTIPAPLSNPFYYEEEDILRPILELPGHDWHENVLKGHNFHPVAWPPVLPWGYPDHKPLNCTEEFQVYKKGIDYTLEYGDNYIYYSPLMHPWSIYKFNKEAKTIELILKYINDIGMESRTYSQIYHGIEEGKIKI